MHVQRSAVTTVLRERGFHDRAQQAECALPRDVDTTRDAGLLDRLGVTPSELETREERP